MSQSIDPMKNRSESANNDVTTTTLVQSTKNSIMQHDYIFRRYSPPTSYNA